MIPSHRLGASELAPRVCAGAGVCARLIEINVTAAEQVYGMRTIPMDGV